MAAKTVNYGLCDVTLSPEAIAAHAARIADKPVRAYKPKEAVFPTLGSDSKRLVAAYRCLHEALVEGVEVPPAAEWILDNFYLLEQSIKQLEQDLTFDALKSLPFIEDGGVIPRTYALAVELVSHHEGKLDEEIIEKYVSAYQREGKLCMAELWALPNMFRVALIKLVVEVAIGCLKTLKQRAEADKLAETLTKLQPHEYKKAVGIIKKQEPFGKTGLLERLRQQLGDHAMPLEALNVQLKLRGIDAAALAQSEHRKQTYYRVLIGNAITSLRMLSRLVWEDMFEKLSLVELVLRKDETYARMDASSRAHYRNCIERIARKLGVDELVAVHKALEIAAGGSGKAAQVGYYLFGKGMWLLTEALSPGSFKLRRFFSRHTMRVYIGAQLVLALALTAIAALGGWLLALLSVIPALSIAQAVVNRAAAKLTVAAFIPKLVPSGKERVLVAVPTLITGQSQLDELLARLETNYVANRVSGASFALLTDFKDAGERELPGEDELLSYAVNGIERLNQKYCEGKPTFLIFHRHRELCGSRWMGKERKRGALMELGKLLRREDASAFAHVSEGFETPQYVITLDADTILPRGAVAKMVGAMEHPLNKPELGEDGLVQTGYAILQPRIGITAKSAAKSVFARIFAGNAGIDTYSFAISDVYQDLFCEGSFTGKGIFELETFMQVLADRFPHNRVLSHDLLEGCYARVGLLSDVQLYDGYPGSYLAWAMRQHRWIRGDWQLLPFLRHKTKNAAGEKRANPINGLSRWKIIDNLRRSLLPVFVFAQLLAAFSLPLAAAPGIVLAAAALFIDIGMDLFVSLAEHFRQKDIRLSLVDSTRGLKQAVERALFCLALLPYEACLSVDAAVRALWRMLVTRKRLLEWVTAAETERAARTQIEQYYRKLIHCPIAAALLQLAQFSADGFALLPAIILSIVWLLAPYLAYWSSKPAKKPAVSEEDKRFLRLVARRTWRYFEDFCTKQYAFFPPDNYQEKPKKKPVNRTSATNIGFGMLSAVAACELGYIGPLELLEHLEGTSASIEKCEKWHGHLYNWYTIPSLEPLGPRYVSTVDSGNLIACLLAVRQAVARMPKMDCKRFAAGLLDTALVAAEEEGAPAESALATAIHLIEEYQAQGEGEQTPDGGIVSLLDMLVSLDFSGVYSKKLRAMAERFKRELAVSHNAVKKQAEALRARLGAIIAAMDFTPLYDKKKELFAIGFDCQSGELSGSYYDLLASEARLTDFIAIALDQVDQKHWFKLGRSLTTVDKRRALISWSGTMFEYLMPLLLLENVPHTLLYETCAAAVEAQKKFVQGIPWGVSESGFYAFDLNMNYQYKAFGVPRVGLRSSAAKDIVISPYSTVLSLMVTPNAVKNLRHLHALGALGAYGYYEALDFTPERVKTDGGFMLVQSYMAHHQGMGLAAICNVLFDNALQKHLHAIPQVRATELLLEERVPSQSVVIREFDEAVPKQALPRFNELTVTRTIGMGGGESFPEAHLLSNGSYSVMLNDTGAGYSKCADVMINRWRPDYVREQKGIFFAINNRTQPVYSAAFFPLNRPASEQFVRFDADKVTYFRRDGHIESTLEVCVPPEYTAEVRRLTLKNTGGEPAELEITAFFEVCMARQADDIAHPAFGKLFVDARLDEDVLLFTRKARAREAERYLGVACAVHGEAGPLEWCTDRLVMPGRGNDWQSALGRPLQQSELGSPIDPVMAVRTGVRIEAGETASVSLILGFSEVEEEALQFVRALRADISRAFELAWTHSQVELKYLSLQPSQAVLFQRALSHLIYENPMRAAGNGGYCTQPKSALWRFGISGDRPIILVCVKEDTQLQSVRLVIKFQEYLRLKGFLLDVVVLCEFNNDYYQPLLETLKTMARSNHSGVFVLPPGTEPDEKQLLKSAAQICLEKGTSLAAALQMPQTKHQAAQFAQSRKYDEIVQYMPPLRFFNGIGGFTHDGREYVMRITKEQRTPLPWSNVLANDGFGTLVTESGGGYTWADNSRECKLTPWYNDVLDPQGEMLLFRDEATGDAFSITPAPCGGSECVVRHGFGYTLFEGGAQELESSLCVFVDAHAPIKYWSVRLRNPMRRKRSMSATLMVEWVLGDSRENSCGITVNFENNALVAERMLHKGKLSAFIAAPGQEAEYTADRAEIFTGAMSAGELSRSVGPNHSGGALRLKFELGPGETKQLLFVMGALPKEQIAHAVEALAREGIVEQKLGETRAFWGAKLGGIRVKTPEESFDIMLNGFLLYQTWASRLYARTGFYQAGGAFGFRDQLQDSLALLHTCPQRLREQIVLCAGKQFIEGDVLHWWHPRASGVRTRITDDRLFLPYAAAEYVSATGDEAIMHEQVPYLESLAIPDGQHDLYTQFKDSETYESIYMHCVRAIEASLDFGAHNLALMGGGDWNDGMDLVGENGGESVWLSMFLVDVLERFAGVCEAQKDTERAKRYKLTAKQLREAIETDGWDSSWYRRAFFGDGAPLGSAVNEECRIDCISQAWAGIIGLENAKTAMRSLEALLLNEGDGILKLLSPPFEHTSRKVGYIQGYLPGIRENGGQYTHGAIWAIIAYASMGEKDKALKLFQLLNPIHHTDSRLLVNRYMGEPYVMAADVYGVKRHSGRAGWTWYTGSSAWMYRAGLEWILGIKRRGDTLEFSPCVPWNEFEVEYTYNTSVYALKFTRAASRPTKSLKLVDDGERHEVVVRFQ